MSAGARRGSKPRLLTPAPRRSLGLAIAGLACAVAGCAEGGYSAYLWPVRGPEQNCACAPAASLGPIRAADEPSRASASESSDKTNPTHPSPHTLCEAIEAYLRKLHEPPPDTEKEKTPAKEKENNGTDSEPKGKGERKASEEKGNGNGGKDGKIGNGDNDNNGKEKEKDKDKKEEESWISVHAQATFIDQMHNIFPAAYTGPHSLIQDEPGLASLTATVFLDVRLWEGGELILNPEVAGGLGFSGVQGIAGFPNGEITRVGVPQPTPYWARLEVRQTIGLGGEQETVKDEANEIAGKRDVDRVTITVGKMSATDLVDDNRYSHDPRLQFLNWALMYNGAWDYPANVRGYTYGATIELNQKYWALRYGVWAEPLVANGADLDPHFLKANGHAAELEERWGLDKDEHPGKVRLMAYANLANMGNYGDALRLMPVDPDVTQTRSYRIKYGFGLNFEQELTKDLGVFSRLGWDDGHTETFAFTPIDRTATLGMLLKGRCWQRPQDEVGLAGVWNGLAQDHRAYLAAGGLDFSIGDGKLNYGIEQIIETYYNLELHKGVNVTADFQEVFNPAYNIDRGPVSVFSLRVHIEF